MAIIAGCFILCIWLVGIPLLTGAVPAFFTERRKHSLSFMWTSGYILSWALFQLVTVPLVLLHVSQGFKLAVKALCRSVSGAGSSGRVSSAPVWEKEVTAFVSDQRGE